MKDILAKLIGIDTLKNNKLYFFCKIILSLIFAITITLDSMLVFQGSVFGSLNEIHFINFTFKNLLIFLVAWIGTYVSISIIEYIVDKLENTIYTKKTRKNKNIKMYFIFFAIILVCWLPYVLSYFPGGIYADTIDSIKQATGEKPYSNNNPLLYTFILKTFIIIGTALGGGLELGMKIFTVAQVLVMAGVISYSIYWLYKRNISAKYLSLVTAFFGLCRLVPMYAISIWKDTPFCIVLYMFSIFLAETVYQNGKNLEKIRGVIKYLILSVLIVFLRNNGIYIIVAITLILIIMYRKNIFKGLKVFSLTAIIEIMICLVIQGPIYSHYKLTTPFVESVGVPLQQICYVVAEEGNLTEDQIQFINGMYPTEQIKQEYNPCIVDKIKWKVGFNNEYIEQNKTEFFKVWFKVFLQNPISYVKAYLLNTIGFWDVNKATKDGYISPMMWENKDEVIGIKQVDYIKTVTGQSIRDIITPSNAVSPAIYLFIILCSSVLVIYKKRYKNLLIYMPAFLTWATIMIAAPLAFSLRYAYILLLMVPMSFVIPFLKTEGERTKK